MKDEPYKFPQDEGKRNGPGGGVLPPKPPQVPEAPRQEKKEEKHERKEK